MDFRQLLVPAWGNHLRRGLLRWKLAWLRQQLLRVDRRGAALAMRLTTLQEQARRAREQALSSPLDHPVVSTPPAASQPRRSQTLD